MKLFKVKVYAVFAGEVDEDFTAPIIIQDSEDDVVRTLLEQTLFIWEDSVSTVHRLIDVMCPYKKRVFITELADHEEVYDNKKHILNILKQLNGDKVK